MSPPASRRPTLAPGVALALFGCATLLLSWPASAASPYSYAPGPVPSGRGRWPCPGDYCGRSPLNATHLGDCGRCPRGWRVHDNARSECRPCRDAPALYDWLFLAFHVLLVLVLHWAAVDYSVRRRVLTGEVLALHACALAEVAAAACASLLLYEPAGGLRLVSCRARRLSDWYSFLHNPTPNYEETLYCTQEVVYPLYTIVFTFYAMCVMFMLLARPLLARVFLHSSSVYAALYFLPALALAHAVLGGLVYVAYPHLVLVLSLVSCAAHFAYKLDQSSKALLWGCVKDSRNLVILLGHWLLHAFGIVSITQLSSSYDPYLLLLIPLPSAFYIATVRFTDPVNFRADLSS